jgi:hypothetical protein
MLVLLIGMCLEDRQLPLWDTKSLEPQLSTAQLEAKYHHETRDRTSIFYQSAFTTSCSLQLELLSPGLLNLHRVGLLYSYEKNFCKGNAFFSPIPPQRPFL